MSKTGDIKDINIMAYKLEIKKTYTPDQLATINGLSIACDKFGIINPYARIAIFSVVGKETNFLPKTETGYGGTPNARIRQLFTSRVAMYNDAQLSELKKDDEKFFNAVYGGMYGNAKDEGFKYCGKGPNQITFKGNYIVVSKLTGIDFVSNPDKLNDPIDGSYATVAYMVDRWDSIPASIGVKTMNDFTDLETAIVTIFRANAGWKKDINTPHHRETLQKCRIIASYFSYV
jgi:putative chitinase